MHKSRNTILLDGDWQFAYTKEAPMPEEAVFPTEEKYEIALPVPAYWDDCKSRLKYTKFWSRDCNFNPVARRIEEFPLGGQKPPDASYPYLLGTGWYRKSFTAEADWRDKCVELCVGGAMLDAWVWLNGEYVGNYYSCGKPFAFALDEYIQFGEENEILIAVSNTRKNKNGCSIRGYKGKSAGINRSVKLVISGKAKIEDCYVRTVSEMDKLIWNVKIRRNHTAENGANSFSESVAESVPGLSLRWRIVNPTAEEVMGEGIVAADSDALCFETDIFGMKPWSDREPVLYTLHLELVESTLGSTRPADIRETSGGCADVVDAIQQSFGLRFLQREGTHILLNGKPVFLRGTTDHAYFPETCTVPNDLSYYMKTIKALKEAGFNWMRFHTTVPPVECMEAADRLGMLIQTETQNGFEETDFINMLMLCRKHPSVILYCSGNEVPIREEVEEKLARMSEHCRALAPDCLYDPMEALLNIECRLDETAPGYTEKPVPYNALKLGRLREFSDVFAPGVWVFSYHSLYADVEKISRRLAIYERPCLIHEAGIFDTYLNLDLEKRYEKTRIGTDLFRAVRAYVDEMGMLENAPTYYRNSCRWMKNLMKFGLEKARRCSSIAGYDFLGATDCHWHRSGYAVGVMNEFYELKAGFTTRELQQFNGESIIVSNAGHERSMFVKERVNVELFASLYGGEELKNGTLFWSLVDDKNRVRLSGTRKVGDIREGVLTGMGEISIGLDEVQGVGEHLKLQVELRGGIYNISNEWDYWVFQKPEKSEKVRVTDKITPQDLEDMEKGARILLLGSGPFWGLPITYQITPGGRVNGNCATVIYDHPLMRDFPHDGFCDWQFAPMFRDGGAVVFNDLGIDFKPIVEIVSTYKLIKKQAGIFELGIGKGGLLVCTMNVRSEDPAAQALYGKMLQYLSSEEFAPQVKVSTAKMLEIMEFNKHIEVDFTTDECYDTGGHIEV